MLIRSLHSRLSHTRIRSVLVANAALLALVGLGEAVISLSLHRPDWGVIWLAVGLLASQTLLVFGLIARQRDGGIEPVIQAMARIVDAQTEAITTQQHEIAWLRSALAGDAAQKANSILSGGTLPDLSTLIESLEEAEDSLPDMLPQTRAWIARVRALATQTQGRVEALRNRAAGEQH